jgi:hypothetical protein
MACQARLQKKLLFDESKFLFTELLTDPIFTPITVRLGGALRNVINAEQDAVAAEGASDESA